MDLFLSHIRIGLIFYENTKYAACIYVFIYIYISLIFFLTESTFKEKRCKAQENLTDEEITRERERIYLLFVFSSCSRDFILFFGGGFPK